jgi:4-hydroxybenzoate polyprenyltransferase
MSRLRAYAQLVRLPNVFTALADIGLAALVTGGLPARWLAFALAGAASACLYCAGMVWNDFFDIDQDRRERPFRPLPSGRITRPTAGLLGVALLLAGVMLALLAGLGPGVGVTSPGTAWEQPSAIVAVLLVLAILAYDAWLKRTWAGPLGMGSCRFLNVLLGVALAPSASWPHGVYLALVVGVYIAGVTWFARTEAASSSRLALTGAALVMLASVALALPLPVVLAASPWPHEPFVLFPYLLVGFGFLIGVPVYRAINRPSPALVQAGVKGAVLGLIVFDAILATAGTGILGLVLLLLLPPALVLGRRLYST